MAVAETSEKRLQDDETFETTQCGPGQSDLPDFQFADSVNKTKNILLVRLRTASCSIFCSEFAAIIDIEDTRLLYEIARLPMSPQSPRLVPPSKGTDAKVAKMLGLDDDDSSLLSLFPPQDTPSRVPSKSSIQTRILSPVPLRNVGSKFNLSNWSAKGKKSTPSPKGSFSKDLEDSHDTMSISTPPDSVRK